jgi:hypothetical protein
MQMRYGCKATTIKDEGMIMRTWIGAALLAASVSFGGAVASAPAMAAPDTTQKATPDSKTKPTDISAQRRHRHFHHHGHFGHRRFGNRHFGYRSGFYPRSYGYGYGYRPHYRSYYGPAYYGRPYAYRPYGYGGYGYRPYGAYGYGGPGIGFGGGPLSIGFGFGRW